MPPFGGIKPVCHDRHKTVPEFIIMICDQMWMTIIFTFTDSLALFTNQGRFDFGRLTFASFFEKVLLIAFT